MLMMDTHANRQARSFMAALFDMRERNHFTLVHFKYCQYCLYLTRPDGKPLVFRYEHKAGSTKQR